MNGKVVAKTDLVRKYPVKCVVRIVANPLRGGMQHLTTFEAANEEFVRRSSYFDSRPDIANLRVFSSLWQKKPTRGDVENWRGLVSKWSIPRQALHLLKDLCLQRFLHEVQKHCQNLKCRPEIKSDSANIEPPKELAAGHGLPQAAQEVEEDGDEDCLTRNQSNSFAMAHAKFVDPTQLFHMHLQHGNMTTFCNLYTSPISKTKSCLMAFSCCRVVYSTTNACFNERTVFDEIYFIDRRKKSFATKSH